MKGARTTSDMYWLETVVKKSNCDKKLKKYTFCKKSSLFGISLSSNFLRCTFLSVFSKKKPSPWSFGKCKFPKGFFEENSLSWFFQNEDFLRGFSRKHLGIDQILKRKLIPNQYKESGSTILKTSENEVSLRASQKIFPPPPKGDKRARQKRHFLKNGSEKNLPGT